VVTLLRQCNILAFLTQSSTYTQGIWRIRPQKRSRRGSSPPPFLASNHSRIATSPTELRSQTIAFQSPLSRMRWIIKFRCVLRSIKSKSQSQNNHFISTGKLKNVYPLIGAITQLSIPHFRQPQGMPLRASRLTTPAPRGSRSLNTQLSTLNSQPLTLKHRPCLDVQILIHYRWRELIRWYIEHYCSGAG